MKIQSKLRLKQGEKRLGEDISTGLSNKYFIEYMYQGIEQRENFKTIPKNALIKNGTYYVMDKINKISYPLLYVKSNKPVKVDNISGANQSDINKSELLNKWNKILDKLNSDLKKPTISKLEKTLIRNDIYRVKNAIKDLKKGISGKSKATKRTKGSNYHKDTKSHNVNIRVISGFKKFIKHKGFTIDVINKDGEKEYAVYQISPTTKKEVYYGSYASLTSAKNFINRTLYLLKKHF